MADWKGIAMVVNQLAQLAEPSKLDLLEREYEMKATENEADRQHTFLLENYKLKQTQLDDLKTQYKTILKESDAISSSLPDRYKDPSNYSGNTDKILNDVIGGQFTNYQAGIEGYQAEIDKLTDTIVNMNAINDAAQLGAEFFGPFKTGEDTYIDDEGKEQLTDYAAEFDDGDGDMSPDEIMAATDAYIDRNYQGEENKDLARAFKIGVSTQHDYQKEQEEMKEAKASTTKMSPADKLEWEIIKGRQKLLAKGSDKIDDAHAIIREQEKLLISRYGTDEMTGGVNWEKVQNVPDDVNFVEWQKQMGILSEVGENYIYSGPIELEFDRTYWSEDDPEDLGYTKDSYYQVIRGIDKDDEPLGLDRELSAWHKKEYEWLINNWDVSDDILTYDPRPGKTATTTVGKRKSAFKAELKKVYGIGI